MRLTFIVSNGQRLVVGRAVVHVPDDTLQGVFASSVLREGLERQGYSQCAYCEGWHLTETLSAGAEPDSLMCGECGEAE